MFVIVEKMCCDIKLKNSKNFYYTIGASDEKNLVSIGFYKKILLSRCLLLAPTFVVC